MSPYRTPAIRPVEIVEPPKVVKKTPPPELLEFVKVVRLREGSPLKASYIGQVGWVELSVSGVYFVIFESVPPAFLFDDEIRRFEI